MPSIFGPSHARRAAGVRLLGIVRNPAYWAHFGSVTIGRAKRTLSCFVMTLSWSRALYLEFFFDQTMESFLRGHVNAFRSFSGAARVALYDNLKSAVLERHGSQIHFNPRLLELAAHYHFVPRPCQVRAGNQKGRVERAIRYVRDSFWQPAPSPRWRSAIARRSSGATRWRINVPGRTIAIALLLRPSSMNSRACCHCRCIRSRPTA